MANSFLVKNVRVFLPKNDNSDTELAESLGDGIDLLCGYDVDGIFITIIEGSSIKKMLYHPLSDHNQLTSFSFVYNLDNVEQEQQKKYQIPSIPAATAQVGDRCCVIEIDNTDGTSLMISFSTSAGKSGNSIEIERPPLINQNCPYRMQEFQQRFRGDSTAP